MPSIKLQAMGKPCLQIALYWLQRALPCSHTASIQTKQCDVCCVTLNSTLNISEFQEDLED